MPRSVTPAMQNDMTTSSDTSKKRGFCNISQRHGNFSLTTVLHLTHVECHKVPCLPRKTTWAHLVTRRKRYVFATFPIGTATFTLRSVKTNVFLRVFLRTYFKIDVSCEASVDFHDNAIRKKLATRHVQSAAHATQNEIGDVQSAAPATKTATHCVKM